MPQHETRKTVSVAAWCDKCRRNTQHRVDDRVRGRCLECGTPPPPKLGGPPSGRTIYVERACLCAAYTFGHFHMPGGKEKVD